MQGIKHETNVMDCFYIEKLTFREGIYYAGNIPDEGELNVNNEGMQISSIDDDAGFWYKHRLSCISHVIKKWLSLGCSFVDIGGGEGRLSWILQSDGFDVALVDPVHIRTERAKERGVNQIVCGLFDASTIKANSVPAIGLFDVLEHIEHDRDFLEGILPMIASQGKIFVTVPAHNFLWSKKDNVTRHCRRYSLRQLKNLLKICGCEILYASYYFSILFPVMLLLKVLPYRIFGSKNSDDGKGTDIVSFQKEHMRGGDFAFSLLAFERLLIRRGIKIPFGTSCILV